MSKVRIDYGDVAIGAKENFSANFSEKADFSDVGQLHEEGLSFPNYANPCELYSVVLDGSATAFPSDTSNKNIGIWSEQISGKDGTFENPIVLTLTATEYFTSSGISFSFDTQNSIFSNRINIKWYRNEEVVSDMDFSPNSAIYFCKNKVEFYNKLVVTFYSINMPYNRLKIRSIEYGIKVSFYGDELRNVKILQAMNAISSEISINTCDFTIESNKNIEFSFQEKQTVSTYFNDELQSTTFISTAKRKNKNQWDIKSEDYIGVLNDIPYYGDIYVDQNAYELIEDIFTVANVPYQISEEFSKITISGRIPYTSCRDALMQVAFAIGAVVDTSHSNVVKVFSLSDDVSQHLPRSRIFQGQSVEDETRVTGVEVASHSYKPISEIATLYEASKDGYGENIFISFSDPMHDLQLSSGNIVSSGANYAIINALSDSILTGSKYEHTITIHRQNNLLLSSSDTENIVSIKDATLVSKTNIDNVLDKCYNYYSNSRVSSMKIIEGKHDPILYGQAFYGGFVYNSEGVKKDQPVNVGEKIKYSTEWMGDLQGRIIEQSYNLNGGIIVKNVKVR